MKRLFLLGAILSALLAFSGSASAQQPVPYPVQPASFNGIPVPAMPRPGCNTCALPRPSCPGGVGLHPALRRLFGVHGCGGVPMQVIPVAQGGGQLAFPQNPFVRSPRDFFMMD